MESGLPKERYLVKRTTLLWYAGQLVDIVDTKSWFAMNSIINCCEKFTGIDHTKLPEAR